MSNNIKDAGNERSESRKFIVSDPKTLGRKLHNIRKKSGKSQEEAAWAAGMSLRAYAEIERGEVNPRLESIIKICNGFEITPNDILDIEVQTDPYIDQLELYNKLNDLNPKEQHTALKLLKVYVDSI